jgi:hypothetical protein
MMTSEKNAFEAGKRVGRDLERRRIRRRMEKGMRAFPGGTISDWITRILARRKSS